MTTGEHGGYEAAARQYNDCIRTGQIAQAVEWLTEMAEILESEKRYTDALKLGMLTFYFATSQCVLHFFQYQASSTFTHHESVTASAERARCGLGRIITCR